ncbi:MAG: glycosyltransferase family 9 protein, partial [Planctomycetota bacterium]
MLGLLSCVDGFIGNDSGITHLAAGLGIRTYGIFGPTN